MNKFFSFVLCILLFLCPFAAQAEDLKQMPQEEIAEAPSTDPMSDEVIRYLQGEDIYQGTLSWQGNKTSTKFNYEMKKEKR
ncbi:hypothetical protein [Prochlorococcus sp. MIT 0916]|uniref:hypothetical protein n=1 Tax=Prochlorococcus sp. MIT 0916 TaxID=3082521 RepID=UPI0039B5165B